MLPIPNLDDRRFQDLVDDAKRMVQQRCPEWTDHNVSDPGVTLIETVAHLVEQLIYRLNRVPEAQYLTFLNLIGVRPLPPVPARCEVTFWLSAAQEQPVVVPEGTQVATGRDEGNDPVIFSLERALTINPTQLTQVFTAIADNPPVERTQVLRRAEGLPCFQDPPVAGDTLLIGLTRPAGSGAVLLQVECQTEGHGIDPTEPPWRWEAWIDGEWIPCQLDRDTSGGFNRSGDIVLHIPAGHNLASIGGNTAAWLCCRVLRERPGQLPYARSPRITGLTASTIGGTISAIHAETITNETLGTSTGVPGQQYKLHFQPVVDDGQPLVVETSGPQGWREWVEVNSFAASTATDRHIMIDRRDGTVRFGPAIRQPDGTIRAFGAVPAHGVTIRVPTYRVGGGTHGNVATGALRVLRDPVPFISSVTNREPARGGLEPEHIRDTITRAPFALRTLDRAVTADDYENLVRQNIPEVRRVRCLPIPGRPGAVRVSVVTAVGEGSESDIQALRPSTTVLERISQYLEQRRCLGARIYVEPASLHGVTVVAALRAERGTRPGTLRQRAVRVLDGYLNPLTGGPAGSGWPFGRPVQVGELFAVLQRLAGVEYVESVRLFEADPVTGEHGPATERCELPQHGLVVSYRHQVRVEVWS